MKVFSSNNLILKLVLLFLSFIYILNTNTGCPYQTEKGGDTVYTDDKKYLTDEEIKNGTEAQQKCFSLSYSEVLPKQCCYSSGKCVREDDGIQKECPNITLIPNNCGMAGVYQPLTAATCTEISLVQGYCCFVQTKTNGTACIRTKELNKDKQPANTQINTYIEKAGSKPNDIDFVVCKGNYIKYYWLLIIILSVLFLC